MGKSQLLNGQQVINNCLFKEIRLLTYILTLKSTSSFLVPILLERVFSSLARRRKEKGRERAFRKQWCIYLLWVLISRHASAILCRIRTKSASTRHNAQWNIYIYIYYNKLWIKDYFWKRSFIKLTSVWSWLKSCSWSCHTAIILCWTKFIEGISHNSLQARKESH